MSKRFDNEKPESGDDAQRDRSEVTHSCIAGALFVLIMKLRMCLSKINILTLDTVVTLFLFI